MGRPKTLALTALAVLALGACAASPDELRLYRSGAGTVEAVRQADSGPAAIRTATLQTGALRPSAPTYAGPGASVAPLDGMGTTTLRGYEVIVRMYDGSRQSLMRPERMEVGERVLISADGTAARY